MSPFYCVFNEHKNANVKVSTWENCNCYINDGELQAIEQLINLLQSANDRR